MSHLRQIMWAILFVASSLSADDHQDESAQRYSVRCDENLCWQDPQKDAYDMTDQGLVATEANRYCEELVLGGFADWRLPDSNELRALIDGSPATEPGGQCALSIGGNRDETLFRACEGSEPDKGPGANDCYLRSDLTGTCNKPGPPQATQALEIWASNRPSDDANDWQAYVSFDRGALGYNHVNSAGDVRCVRGHVSTAKVADKVDLLPENIFVTEVFDPASRDACVASDKLILNITVPAALTATPEMLMVFFYRADKWKFPPAGPPDGGTDYNTIENPQFSADGKLTTTLPGCTFYRERMLSGDFRVYVQLLMEKRRPPMVAKGDYYWGSNTETFTLPLNGTRHRGVSQTIDISLWPVVN